ncbi:MAG: ORF6N domain-containing protein [Acidobacteriia bacterium]|nr:ORF6N domain-containing protein [Terriglobia bacterium]
MTAHQSLIRLQQVERLIHLIRNQKVMLDQDLAELYGVSIRRLNEQVRRNLARFPPDFMFQLTVDEYTFLRSQFATLKPGRGKHRKYRPYAFTEQGVAMLSSVLNSDRAVQVNPPRREIMRAFVRLRQMAISHADLARKLEGLERKYDSQFKVVFDALRRLMTPPQPRRRRIGFHVDSR